IKKDSAYRVSEAVEEGSALFEAAKQMGLEGIMAKQRNSAYLHGKRSESWLKIKTRQTLECAIIGYTRGKGDREMSFGALHLAQAKCNDLKYVGKVGGRFDERALKSVFAEVEQLTKINGHIQEKPHDDEQSRRIDPNQV